jgi:hypothetical protein
LLLLTETAELGHLKNRLAPFDSLTCFEPGPPVEEHLGAGASEKQPRSIVARLFISAPFKVSYHCSLIVLLSSLSIR